MTIIFRWNFIAILTLTTCLAFGADTTPSPNPPSVDIPALVKKAESGDPEAQCNLGVRYAQGDGVPKDAALAVSWYCKAAEQGHAKAQYDLGASYGTGNGVPRDEAIAVTWYRKAAEQGHAKAQFILGICYVISMGVRKNDVLAYMWLNLSAEQGNPDAITTRDEISEKMTPEQIAEAQRLSREWKPTKAKE